MFTNNSSSLYKQPYILLLILFSISWGDSFYSLSEKGQKAYQQQQYDSAVIFFEEAKIKSPERDDISFNLAHAYYKNKQFDQAKKLYQEGLQYGDSVLFPLYHYNLGNALFKQAEQALLQRKNNQKQTIQNAIEKYTQSIESYRNSYKLDSTSTSTEKNLNLSYHRLEKLKEFQKEQKKNNKEQTPPSKDAKAKFKKVIELVNQNNFIKAEILLQDLIIKDPTAQIYKSNLKRISKINQISTHSTL